MNSRRIVLTLTKRLADFLDEMKEATGVDDCRDLILLRLWRWRQEERDLRIAEARITGSRYPALRSGRQPRKG
jgi:hypothetical protein